MENTRPEAATPHAGAMSPRESMTWWADAKKALTHSRQRPILNEETHG